MKSIIIKTKPGYEEWRQYARLFLAAEEHPAYIDWREPDPQGQLNFDQATGTNVINIDLENLKKPVNNTINTVPDISVPKAFIQLAQTVCCHADIAKYHLLYKLLWRIIHGEKKLLNIFTDNDVMAANTMAKAVGRDTYKMTAHLRFREIQPAETGEPHYVCWYQPEHYVLERNLNFFKNRFRNMNWSILTPYRGAHWNQENLTLFDNPDPSLIPKEDAVEEYWLTYYASTFNPARLKVNAMLNQMPYKRWKNLPEAKLINTMVRQARRNEPQQNAYYFKPIKEVKKT